MLQSRRLSGPPIAERILVIRLGALGDVVRTLPAVTALRALYPGSHLCWLVEPAAAAVVEASGCVDETLVFARGELVQSARQGEVLSLMRTLRRFVRRLRARRFELVLDFHGIAKSGLLARLTGAPIRLGHGRGIAREGAHLFSNHHAPLDGAQVSRFVRNAALVHALAPALPVPSGPLLSASPAARERLEAQLRAMGRERARGFVLIHPGSSAGASHKRYAPAAWCTVANRLIGSGHEVWIVAGPAQAERSLVSEIRAGCDERLVEAPATEAVDDLLALMARAGVFAACDSGPLHIASLAGLPVVQLLGPTDPVHNEPAAASAWRRVHVPLPCSPCRRGCADASCMRAIAPERVVAAIHELAARAGGSTSARDADSAFDRPGGRS